jgi:hypothetical protein
MSVLNVYFQPAARMSFTELLVCFVASNISVKKNHDVPTLFIMQSVKANGLQERRYSYLVRPEMRSLLCYTQTHNINDSAQLSEYT